MIIKHNKKTFSDVKMMSIKKILIISLLVFVFVLTMFLILTVGQNGFNEIDVIFNINKNLIIVIPVASSSISISSLILQQLSKNKLADSSVLGIGNINLISLILIIFSLDLNSGYEINNYLNVYPFIFIIVSILTCFFIYMISYKKNRNISKKFIIVGLILNFTFISISSSISAFLPSGKNAVLKQFINGFISSSTPLQLYVGLTGFIIGTIWLLFIFQKLNISTLNYSIAESLGIKTSSIHLQALLICGLLSGVSYILVGNLSFLGLLAGNISYSLYKRDYNYSFPASCLIGSIIVGLVFFLNKNILQSNVNTPGLIPIMGIPYFLYLVVKGK